MVRRKLFAASGLALVVAAVALIHTAQSQEPPTLRFAVIGSGGQSEAPYAIREAGLDRKYGVNIALIAAYRDLERRIDNPPYSAALIKPTQDALDAIIAIAGEQAVGVTTIDPAAFLFP